METSVLYEKDLEVYDVWQAPNGNLFIKMTDNYSIAIGAMGDHEPNDVWGDLKHSQYVKRSDIAHVIKVGRIIFD